MNVRYLGTRSNKRQVRGGVTEKRYSYSLGRPIFTIDPADELQFHGEIEDGRPKFALEDRPFADSIDLHAQGIQQLQEECIHERLTDDGSSCVECGWEFVDVVVTGSMTVEEIASLTIRAIRLHLNAYPMSRADLETLMHLEDIGECRKGAYAVITAAINALA